MKVTVLTNSENLKLENSLFSIENNKSSFRCISKLFANFPVNLKRIIYHDQIWFILRMANQFDFIKSVNVIHTNGLKEKILWTAQ